jgi:hypothetical protein
MGFCFEPKNKNLIPRSPPPPILGMLICMLLTEILEILRVT